MTALELNTQIYRYMADISVDEALLQKVADYMKKLLAKKPDPTLMTKEQFYAKLERGEKAYERGECHEILPNENLTSYLIRRGYDLQG